MPHIDDGILHAYLDGALDAIAEAGELPDGMQAADVLAHFEQCADCRSRLETERTVRERAGIVLRAAAPQTVHTPPLAPAAPPRRNAWLPYAWAASLMMAVGAGWWGSRIADQAELASSETLMQDSRSAAPAPAPESDRVELRPPAEDAGVAASPPSVGAAAEKGVRERQTARAPQQRTGDVAGFEAASAVEQAPVAVAPPPPAPPPAAPPSAGAGADAARAQRSYLMESAPGSEPLLAEPSLLTFIARDSAGQVLWQSLTEEQARAVAPRAYALADAEVVGYDTGLEVGATVTRVRQRLESGGEIDVITWEPMRIALEAPVVTGVESRQPQRDTARPPAAASTRRESDRPAEVRITPRRADDTRVDTTHRMGAAWVVVRAPAHLTADQIRARLARAGG